jgi:hypothetical protein
LELSNAEANIKTINKALVRTGYKVGMAYSRIENDEKANELMDRKGGGPVPWDQFYGKTAMSFYNRASGSVAIDIGRGAAVGEAQWNGSRLTRIDRPQQFDSIYRANDAQIANAVNEIASLQRDQAKLLSRRQKHEADQVSLWAELAWERIKDREVGFRPLYQYALAPAGPRVELLRGPILFLRAIDKAVSDELDHIESEPGACFADLQHRSKIAYSVLQAALANASITDGLSAGDRTEIDAIKALCKETVEECAIMASNHRKALDSDRAKEDGSKLEFRQELQLSLARFSGSVAALDERIARLAESWSIKPDVATKSPDALPGAVDRPVVESDKEITALATAPAAPAVNATDGSPAVASPTKSRLDTERAKLSRALAGTVWVSGGRPYRFNADGTGSDDKETWLWVAIDGKEIYIRAKGGWTDRLTFDDQLKTFSFQEYGNGTTRGELAGKRSPQ